MRFPDSIQVQSMSLLDSCCFQSALSCIALPVADNTSVMASLGYLLPVFKAHFSTEQWIQRWLYSILQRLRPQNICRTEELLSFKLLSGHTDDDGLFNETGVIRSPGVGRNLPNSQRQPCPLLEMSNSFHVELSGNGSVTPWQTEFCPIQSAAGGLLLRCIHCPKKDVLKSAVVCQPWPRWSIPHLVRSLSPKTHTQSVAKNHVHDFLPQIKTFYF